MGALMANNIIDTEFNLLCNYFEKKINKIRRFKPLTVDTTGGSRKKVIYIGSPGKATAVSITLLLSVGIYLSYALTAILIWIIYIIIAIFLVPFTLKMDKAFQLRIYAMSMAIESGKMIELSLSINNNSTDLLVKAKNNLLAASNYLYEPSIERQIKNIENELKKCQG